MVLTVSLNPAIDKTIELEKLVPRSLNKELCTHQDVGGKGINVSRVLRMLGTDSLALGFIAGQAGRFIEDKLREMDIDTAFVEIDGETRTNLKIFDQSEKEITEINEPGANATEENLLKLIDVLNDNISKDTIVVLSGSAPKSLGDDVYEKLTSHSRSLGAKVFLDVDGKWFNQGIKAKPDFIKPNRSELEHYFGEKIDNDEKMISAIQYFLELGIENVFVTLGTEGAYFGSDSAIYKMEPLEVDAHSSVGAGDAFVGAVVHAVCTELDIESLLKLAVATSAGAVTTIGTKPPEYGWIEAHFDKVKLKKIN